MAYENQDYEQNGYNNQYYGGEKVVSLGDWVITLIVLAIPLVGFIMTFVWGFSASTPPSKANYCKAVLIFYAIGIVLSVVFGGALLALLGFTADPETYMNVMSII